MYVYWCLNRQLLSKTASQVDAWVGELPQLECSAEELYDLKLKVSEVKSLDELVGVIFSDVKLSKAATWEVGQSMLAEIAAIAGAAGPLTEFPPDINSNIYSRVLEYGMDKLPHLTALLARLSIRSSAPVLPSDVVSISNALSNICYLANRKLDGVVKTRTFALQADGITNEGLDLLHSSGLAMTARSLNDFRDKFAEVGPRLLEKLALKHPTQTLLDNLNFRSSSGAAQENLMIKCSVVEAVDTRALSVAKKEKTEVLKAISVDQVLLHSPGNEVERCHLERKISLGWAQVLAQSRPRAEKLGEYLKTPKKKVPPAVVNTDKIYPCNETSHAEMVRLAYQLQSEHLHLVASYKGFDKQLVSDLKILEDVDVDEEEREAAEQRVHEASEDFGCWIGYGDQLTWQVMSDVKVLVAQEVTAFGRLEYLGPFRLGGLHSLMKKCTVDFKAVLPKLTNFSDPSCMAQLVSRSEQAPDLILEITNRCSMDKVIFNEKKKIISNDTSFERHHQFFGAVGNAFGI